MPSASSGGEGFTTSYTLAHDPVFNEVRSQREFKREIDEAARVERETRRANPLNLMNPLQQA
ncbi:MAG TPA: hypothetical protein VFU28_20785 [Vicinamibacterales bacterium]|nr:hypothetical protein [Vicinamibacterales bacterium]